MTSANPKPRASEVCEVCGGRKAACDVLGHRQPGDKTEWQMKPKPRAGEHTPETKAAAMDYGRGRSMGCVSETFAAGLESARDALAAQNRRLMEALEALTIWSRNGEQLCFRTRDDVPMAMGKKQEKLARAALSKVRP